MAFLLFKPAVCQKDKTDVKVIVEFLASDSLKGRAIGTQEVEIAGNYIIDILQELNIGALNTDHDHKQAFTAEGVDCFNVSGYINNGADSTVVLSAHYDHIAICSELSKELYKEKQCQIHNGANDNASGVALVLDLAEELVDSEEYNQYNYTLCFFSAHEVGLYGSKYYSTSSAYGSSPVAAVYNFDMVGRLDQNSRKIVVGTNYKTERTSVSEFRENHQIEVVYNDRILENSDASVLDQNSATKVYTISTGVNEDYHRVSDTAEKINYEGITLVKEYVKHLILQNQQ